MMKGNIILGLSGQEINTSDLIQSYSLLTVRHSDKSNEGGDQHDDADAYFPDDCVPLNWKNYPVLSTYFSSKEQLMYLQYLVTLSVRQYVRPPFYVNIIQAFMST